MDIKKRRQNESKFGSWEELPDVGRRYWHEVTSRSGGRARYIKEVDLNEKIVRFYQEETSEKHAQCHSEGAKRPKNLS